MGRVGSGAGQCCSRHSRRKGASGAWASVHRRDRRTRSTDGLAGPRVGDGGGSGPRAAWERKIALVRSITTGPCSPGGIGELRCRSLLERLGRADGPRDDGARNPAMVLRCPGLAWRRPLRAAKGWRPTWPWLGRHPAGFVSELRATPDRRRRPVKRSCWPRPYDDGDAARGLKIRTEDEVPRKSAVPRDNGGQRWRGVGTAGDHPE